MTPVISVRGARTHNLKNVSFDLPRGKLIVIAGPSGSGKSSLAFDTLYAEGERRYVESLSPRARQFLEQLPRADVDAIEGLPPALAIGQPEGGLHPKSTAGTLTEIDDHLRLLFARAGTAYCPVHGEPLEAEPVAAMTERLLSEGEGRRILIAAPLWHARTAAAGEAQAAIAELLAQGYRRVRIDGEAETFEEPPEAGFLADGRPHDLEAVVDRLRPRTGERERIAQSLEAALAIGGGRALAADMDSEWSLAFSSRNACPRCDFAAGKLEPGLFSSSSPTGACPACSGAGFVEAIEASRLVADPERSLADGALEGWTPENPERWKLLVRAARQIGAEIQTPWKHLPESVRQALLWGDDALRALEPPFPGIAEAARDYFEKASAAERRALAHLMTEKPCPECGGGRLCREARAVTLGGPPGEGKTFPEIEAMPVDALYVWLSDLRLTGVRGAAAREASAGALTKLRCLIDLGLGYLTLDRRGQTLSGGEMRRIRLAAQLGSGLSGVLYVLDEPTSGLHPKDTEKLLHVLERLRAQGNTVLAVEHDRAVIEAADWLVDMGPGAGELGGEVVAAGTVEAVCRNPASITGKWLTGEARLREPIPESRAEGAPRLKLIGASGRNLKDVTLEIPVGCLTVITGVSGSGKSTLAADTLLPALRAAIAGEAQTRGLPFRKLEGAEYFDAVIEADQSPLGRSARSNAATYTGAFTPIRELFAETLTARERGYSAARFGFNARGGCCEACGGEGVVRVPMQFLPDLYAVCDVCGGERYNSETLECRWQGLSIADVLNMTVSEARERFAAHPQIRRRLDALADAGLDYIRLGQSTAGFSGGEAQRLKLAAELARPGGEKTLYLLDEPTTGLHFSDCAKLLRVLRRLTERGATVLVIEHDMQAAAAADWVIDMGPGAGDLGGRIAAAGTPWDVARAAGSPVAPWLLKELQELEAAQKPGRCG